MKTPIRHLMSFLLIVSLLIAALPVYGADSDMLRIGLYYGSDALTSANLENSAGYGAGYRFGYFDSDLQFVELASTNSSVTTLTVLRASTIYRSGSNYSMTDNGGDVIGCYHIAVATGLSSYTEASSLASQYSGGFVAWIQGDYQVRMGTYLTKDAALSAQSSLGLSGEIVGTSSYAVNAVQTGSSQILFQYDGGEGGALGVYPDVTGVSEIRTWFKGYRYNGGFRYERMSGGDLTVTNVVDMETYVKGVVPYEMNNAWPLEALKVQAICARTYAQIRLETSKHAGDGFELCTSTCCQVYNGVGTSTTTYQANALTDQAVEETAGELLWYNGALAQTYYSSSHGGGSENIENIWGGNLEDYPYLCGVIDPYEQLVASQNSYSSWTRTFTSTELTEKLQAKGYGIGTEVVGLEAIYSSTGNVTSLVFHFSNGKTVTFGPTNMRSSTYLGLPAIRFNINGNVVETDGTTTTTSTFSVNGGEAMADLDDLYVIDGDGTKTSIDVDDSIYVLTGTGETEEVDFVAISTGTATNTDVDLSGSVYTEASTYTFNGAGWGHQVGMSQWGAYAMASVMGMDYEEIVTFYFPGTYVG